MRPGTLRLPAHGINQYTMPVKGEELRAAEAHIARLEEELLRLKDVKRDLQALREEHRRLRRSAEGRVAKILSAPFWLFRRRQSTESVEQDEYGRWFAQHRVSVEEAAKLREQSRMFSYRPLISILTPTFNADEKFLMDAVESVIAQVYENWELVLVDDGSSDTRVRGLLEELGQRDARIQTSFQDHGGISSALNTALAQARDGFRSEFDGAQDYDLLLRVSEKTERIRHIPRVLYHWWRTAESTAHNIRRKPGALEAGRHAIEGHLERRQENARVAIDWGTHLYRVRREVGPEKISIIFNGELDRRAIDSAQAGQADRIRAKTNSPNFEIVTDLKEATGEYVLLLDSDLEPLDENWLTAMAEQLSNPKIGAVGARIISSDDTVESAGLILLPDGSVRFAFAGYARDFRGANRQLQAVRNYSAVSASCLLTRRELFEKIASSNMAGSLDFAPDDGVCAAVEFCLNLREQGLRTVSVPYAELRRTSKKENACGMCLELQQRWPEMFRRDPYYNPNLSSERADFSLGT